MKKLIILFCILSFSTYAQFKNIKIYENSAYPLGTCEPSIVVNPTNPANVIAGSILDRFYVSLDSGKTWSESQLSSKSGVYGDPCLVADKENHVYYLHLSDPEGKGWSSEKLLDRIVVQRSDDGGKIWVEDSYMGLNAPKDQDKEWAAVDLRNGNIVATWTQFDKYNSKNPDDHSNILFSSSTDLGKTWSDPIQINELQGDCLDDDQTTEGAVPTFGPKGEIYVAWSYDEKIYFDRSLDFGKTWLDKDVLVANQPGGWTMDIKGLSRCNGMPVTGCDVSGGAFNGAIYVCWGQKDKTNGEILFASSMNKGKTWSKPIRVNDDEGTKDQFLPWMSVDPVTGYIYVVFYDRRNYDDSKTDVYLAYSKDAGQTWVNEKISDTPFKPAQLIFFGDYNNISAYDSIIRPIWTRYEKGKLSVWTALINMK